MATKKQAVKKAKPAKTGEQKQKKAKPVPVTKPESETLRTTQAECENRDPIGNGPFFSMPVCQPESRETEETAPDLPRYQDGCPECGEHSLVTEQKIHSWRVCHCRECEWRGEMED
jgi:hypothetical protein